MPGPEHPIEPITLSLARARDLGIAKKKESYELIPEKIEERGKQIKITAHIDGRETTLTFAKDKLTERQCSLIALCYVRIGRGYDESANKNAKEYLTKAIKEEIGARPKREPQDWLPYFLIAACDLEIEGLGNVAIKMYHFLKQPEQLSHDFYVHLYEKESNPLRKLNVAKIASEYYPHSTYFIALVAEHLASEGKQIECLRYLIEKKTLIPSQEWQQANSLRFMIFNCFLGQGKFEEAIQEASTPLYGYSNDEDYAPILRAIALGRQGDWQDATNILETVVHTSKGSGPVIPVALYYLLKCYINAQNILGIKGIAETLSLDEMELMPFEAPFYFIDSQEIIDTLTYATSSKKLAIDEMTRAKLKGILAYKLYRQLPNPYTYDYPRKLTSVEQKSLERALQLTKDALEYFPAKYFFNALCSNLFCHKREFDTGMQYKLRAIAATQEDWEKEGLYMDVGFEDCSSSYLHTYAHNVKTAFAMIGRSPKNYLENGDFEFDIKQLWKRKLYSQIAGLYEYVKEYTDEWNEAKQLEESSMLFEIAYSLSECEALDEAREVYRLYIKTEGETSAVLNNLAIIYEQTGNLAKAKEIIKKAHKLDPDDDTASRNYQRLFKTQKKVSSRKDILAPEKTEMPIDKAAISQPLDVRIISMPIVQFQDADSPQANHLKRSIAFRNNGDLLHKGEWLARFTPGTSEYYFALILWDHFNEPVSHEDIFDYCKKKIRKAYSETAQSFCNKRKSNIIKALPKAVAGKILVSTKTVEGLNAYQMVSPD
ncbi:MAG: tetratricopeptide repeat protein [Candidatus Andersenbacteria bacterium]|nr:tetratricopeptide repeat protein [Candidatus Andersenbacteria bacterium]